MTFSKSSRSSSSQRYPCIAVRDRLPFSRVVGMQSVPESQVNHFIEESLDDLLREAITSILDRGEHLGASRGSNRELRGVTLELTQPRARLSRSETRGRVFSPLAELLWYLSGRNDTAFISHYISRYAQDDEDGVIFGGYGPRLRGPGSDNQLGNVIRLLSSRPTTRRAVIQVFSGSDLIEDHKDVPCTCTLQFLNRQDGLELIVNMRSNDAHTGLPHDVFCFTMLQEIVARSIGVEVGRYIHMVGSLHLYEKDTDSAQRFLGEGWFGTSAMPPMPLGDPLEAIEALLSAEQSIRERQVDPLDVELPADPYWSDLTNLLVVLALDREERWDDLIVACDRLNDSVYNIHIEDRLERRRNHQ